MLVVAISIIYLNYLINNTFKFCDVLYVRQLQYFVDFSEVVIVQKQI